MLAAKASSASSEVDGPLRHAGGGLLGPVPALLPRRLRLPALRRDRMALRAECVDKGRKVRVGQIRTPGTLRKAPLLMRTDSAVRPVVGDDDFDVEVAGDGQLPTRFRSLGKPPLPQNATRYWAAFLGVATRTAEFRVSG